MLIAKWTGDFVIHSISIYVLRSSEYKDAEILTKFLAPNGNIEVILIYILKGVKSENQPGVQE